MSIFSRKKKNILKITPEALLASGFAAACTVPSGGPAEFQTRPLDAADTIPGTNAILVFSGSNVPIAALATALAGTDPTGEKLRQWCRSWITGGALARDGDITLCEMPLDIPGREAFKWQVMELNALCLGAKKDAVDACLWLSAPLWETVKARAEAAKPEPAETTDTSRLSASPGYFLAGRPRDIPVLEAFCAPSFRAGNANYATVFDGFGAFRSGGEASVKTADPLWFKASFEYLETKENSAPKALSYLYAFSKSALGNRRSEAEKAQLITGLAGALFTESLKYFYSRSRLQSGRFGLKAMEAAPDMANAGPLLCVDFCVQTSSLSLPGTALIPMGAVLLMSQAWKLTGAPEKMKAAPATLVFELNSRMLSAVLPNLLARTEFKAKIPHFCLNELLRQLSHQDYALVLQNVLLPEYGAKDLPALLFYNVTANGPDGQPREYILPYGPLEGQRMEAFMPEAFKPEFLLQVRSLHGRGIEECAALNGEALHKILQAVLAKRIGASPRLTFLMKEMVLKGDQAETAKKLTEYKTQGIPFAHLHKLEAKAGQRVYAVLDDRDIAMALLDCETEIPGMRKFVSAARVERLREDIVFQRKLIKNGTLDLAATLTAKEKIMTALAREKAKDQKAV